FAFFLPGALPLLLVLVALAVLSGGLPRYKTRFPNLNYRSLRLLTASPAESGTGSQSAATRLLDTEKIPWGSEERKRPLVVVSASGGGIRAAAWTLAVLEQLEHTLATRGIAFPYLVRLVTGASGGMVGASYYVSTLLAPDPNSPSQVQRPTGLTLAGMVENVCRDSLTKLVYRMVYGDLLRGFLPFSFSKDRGVVLEEKVKGKLGRGPG